MSDREDIVADLRKGRKQQKRAGVERVVLDRERLAAAASETLTAAVGAEGPRRPTEQETLFAEPAAPPQRKPGALDPDLRATLAARHPSWIGSDLMQMAVEIDACRACSLGGGRMNSVPGTGNPHAKLVFVGEAPGAEEDKQGIPFVGRAGQLLDKILQAIELERKDVHMLNILKCRPPDNRNPSADEIVACRGYLERQIDSIGPGILVALGLFAGQWLTGQKLSLTKLREEGPFEYRGIPVYATYHPAALLRNPNWKRPAWEDFKTIRKEYDKL